MFELFSKVVDKVGPSNVVQFVTDSASNNVLAGKYLIVIVFMIIVFYFSIISSTNK